MHSKYTAHISSNGSHFLTAGFLGYYTYKVTKNGYIGQSYCEYTANISSNGSHFLMAWFLVYCTYKVTKMGTSDRVRGYYVL